jgi:hypothetical protein
MCRLPAGPAVLVLTDKDPGELILHPILSGHYSSYFSSVKLYEGSGTEMEIVLISVQDFYWFFLSLFWSYCSFVIKDYSVYSNLPAD